MEKVDINSLSVQQLSQIREQFEKELEHLSESFSQLRQAQGKFQECRLSVKDASAKGNEGKDLLVPLSATLYVPGKMKNPDTYIVDIGTDYYVEKNAEDTIKFFTNKIETLNKNLVDLDKIVNEKMSTLQAVNDVFKKKIGEAQKEQQQQQQAQAKASA